MEIAARAIEMKARGEDIIDLTVGEPDFPTPENIKLAAKLALDNNQTKYTLNTGIFELRKAISGRYKKEHYLEYSPNQIIVSAGAKQCLFNAIQTIVDEGDEVIVPVPNYVSYGQMIRFAGGELKIISTTDSNNFKITSTLLKKAVTQNTKLIVMCNPCNPTGAFYNEEELKSIADIVLENDLYVVMDEIYEKLLYDGNRFTCFASLSEDIKNRTIVVNGISKSYSMTGWRLGYAAAPLEVINAMAKLQSHSTGNASSISQYAALEALTGPQDSVLEMKNEFEKRRNFIFDSINSIRGITAVKPQGAFYIFPNITKFFGRKFNRQIINNSCQFTEALLDNAKVSVVPGSAFGGEGYVRISFSSPVEILKKGIERIEAFANQLI